MNMYKFTGKERDTESNLDYFGARYYDSEIGRWISVDPLADKYPGWSPYNYCMNSPLKFVDPDGRDVKMIYRKPHGLDKGHIILAVINDKTGKETAVWSFGPKETSIAMLAGYKVDGTQIKGSIKEQLKGFDYEESILKTSNSFDKKLSYLIEGRKQDNEEYDLNDNNCAQTALYLLKHAGLNIKEIEVLLPSSAMELFKKLVKEQEEEEENNSDQEEVQVQ